MLEAAAGFWHGGVALGGGGLDSGVSKVLGRGMLVSWAAALLGWRRRS